MIAKTLQDKMLHEAQVKFERDAAWRLLQAKKEGHEKGLEKARQKRFEEGFEQGLRKGLVAQIRSWQQLLGLPVANEADLDAQKSSELRALVDDLQQQLRKRIT